MSRPSAIDLDEYVAALPIRKLSAPKPYAPKRFQTPGWPLLKPYNGFSGIERRRGGQLVDWLRAAGCLELPSQCDICAGSGPLGLHSETYYHADRCPTLCRRCHRALHLRPYQWTEWRRIVDASAITGREWFALAPQHGVDIAQHLRNRMGWQVADIERSPLTPLPECIRAALPGNMLPTGQRRP